jgi:hypothetical protein
MVATINTNTVNMMSRTFVLCERGVVFTIARELREWRERERGLEEEEEGEKGVEEFRYNESMKDRREGGGEEETLILFRSKSSKSLTILKSCIVEYPPPNCVSGAVLATQGVDTR